jgi:hypothetical protein
MKSTALELSLIDLMITSNNRYVSIRLNIVMAGQARGLSTDWWSIASSDFCYMALQGCSKFMLAIHKFPGHHPMPRPLAVALFFYRNVRQAMLPTQATMNLHDAA